MGMGRLELHEVPAFPWALEFSDWVAPCWRELGRLIHIFLPATHALHSAFSSPSPYRVETTDKAFAFLPPQADLPPPAHRWPFSDHVTLLSPRDSPPPTPPLGPQPAFPRPRAHVTASLPPDWLLPFTGPDSVAVAAARLQHGSRAPRAPERPDLPDSPAAPLSLPASLLGPSPSRLRIGRWESRPSEAPPVIGHGLLIHG